MTKKPVVIALNKPKAHKTFQSPADAEPVPEEFPATSAVQTATRLIGRKPSLIGRIFWIALTSILGLIISVAFWDFVAGLLTRNIWLGRIALGLSAVLIVALLIFALRELAAFARLRKLDSLRALAKVAKETGALKDAQNFQTRIMYLYQNRDDLAWARASISQQPDAMDADTPLVLVETKLVAVLDKQAEEHIVSAARQVATATAIIPLALVDVAVALTANIRMIRRIAEVYGGRSGSFGSWRLMRAVAVHLVATGAVAIGDDMIGTIAGGGVLSKLSRRFGEGIINGALTARVGVAAIEVCRPMPFEHVKRPSVTVLMKRALTGFLSKG